MNNSLLAFGAHSLAEETQSEDRTVALRKREEELVRIIKALDALEVSEAWSSLKNDVFEPLRNTLELKIFQEATKEKPDMSVLNGLRGEWTWAKRYADLSVFRNEKRVELIGLRKSLYGTNE